MLDNENQGFSQEENHEKDYAQQELQQEQMSTEPNHTNAEGKKKRSKHAQYRAIASTLTVLVIAAVVVVNLLVGALGGKINTKIDLTHDRVLDFSEETIEIVKNLQQDVHIYALYTDIDDIIVGPILERYQNLSGHIKFEVVDTAKNPTFVQKYQKAGEKLSANHIIFASGDRYQTVDINGTLSGNGNTTLLSAEQKFTSAIQYVVSTKDVSVAVVEGHGEQASSFFSTILESSNYTVESVNLLSADIGEAVEILVIAGPQADYTAEEIDKIDQFFDRGGSVQVFMDTNSSSLPKLDAYLAEWGVTFYPGYVLDGDPNGYTGYPTYLLPKVQNAEYMQSTINSGFKMLVPEARGIEIRDVVGIDTQALLVTSDNSAAITNPEDQTGQSAVKGPITLAAMLGKYTESGKTARLFVAGDLGFLDENLVPLSSLANEDFYLSLSSYMSDNDSNLYIRPKDMSVTRFSISQGNFWILAVITILIIPLIVLISGIVVWIRRRHL